MLITKTYVPEQGRYNLNLTNVTPEELTIIRTALFVFRKTRGGMAPPFEASDVEHRSADDIYQAIAFAIKRFEELKMVTILEPKRDKKGLRFPKILLRTDPPPATTGLTAAPKPQAAQPPEPSAPPEEPPKTS